MPRLNKRKGSFGKARRRSKKSVFEVRHGVQLPPKTPPAARLTTLMNDENNSAVINLSTLTTVEMDSTALVGMDSSMPVFHDAPLTLLVGVDLSTSASYNTPSYDRSPVLNSTRRTKKPDNFDPSEYLGATPEHRAAYKRRARTRLVNSFHAEDESIARSREKDVTIQRLVYDNSQLHKKSEDLKSNRCEKFELKAAELTKLQKNLGLDIPHNADNVTRRAALARGLKKLPGYILKTWDPRTGAHAICSLVTTGVAFGKEVGNSCSQTIGRSFGNTVIESWRVMRAIDMSTVGGCNVRGVQTFWDIEDKKRDPRDKFDRRGYSILPSRKAISDDRARLQHLIRKTIKLDHDPNNPNGDHVKINTEQLLRYVLKKMGLYTIAQEESIEICISVDAAQLTLKSHTTAGFKFTDLRSVNLHDIDKTTGKPKYMFVQYDNNGEMTYTGCQSRDNCAIAEVFLANESKAVMRAFGDFFKFTNKLGEVGLPANGNEPALKPFKVACPADKSALQKLTGRGGACKQVKYFCTYCACHSDLSLMAHKCGDDVCEQFCKPFGRTICRHMAVDDKEELVRKAEFLYDEIRKEFIRVNRGVPGYMWQSELPENLQTCFTDDGNPTLSYWEYVKHLQHTEELQCIVERTVLQVEVNVACNIRPEDNPIHLDFVAPTAKKSFEHLSKVHADLYLRKFSDHELKDLSRLHKIELLHERNKLAGKIECFRAALELDEKAIPDRLVEIHQAIMCILHLENRTGE